LLVSSDQKKKKKKKKRLKKKSNREHGTSTDRGGNDTQRTRRHSLRCSFEHAPAAATGKERKGQQRPANSTYSTRI
jgi:hypothetical protein